MVQAYNNEPTIKILPQLNHKNYIYELFLLIIEKHRFKATIKTLSKVYHIIYSLCRSTHEESNKIKLFIL